MKLSNELRDQAGLTSKLFIVAIGLLAVVIPSPTQAAELPSEMVLKTSFRTWEINPARLDLFSEFHKTNFAGLEVSMEATDQEKTGGLVTASDEQGLDMMKIRRYLETVIAPEVNREKTAVVIDMNENGEITFEGTGLYGRQLDVERAASMMKYALENNMKFVTLPLFTQDPEVTVNSEELKKMGIVEFISSGETDFSGSPGNRIYNIKHGLSKFYGHLVKPGEEFSFNQTIGPINGGTGYLPELVIKGNKTLPEYGGGLCQVSTTIFRAVLAAGYPISDRRNHSYMVSYYDPQGLDATIYEGGQDFKFVNDTDTHLLIQSFTEGYHTYYNFYGTKLNRQVHMIGPFYSNWRSAPAAKTEYSSSLAPGQRQVVGHAVPGVNITWYRHVTYNDGQKDEAGEKKNFLETIFSNYQARPNYYIVGGAAPEETPTEEVEG